MKNLWCYLFIFVLSIGLSGYAQPIYQVELSEINTDKSDFSPFLWQSELYFCSRRKPTGKSKKETLTDGYVAKVDGNFIASDAELIQGLHTNLHEGPFSLTADGQTMFFSKNYDPKLKTLKLKEFPVGIFIAKRSADGGWSDVVPFTHNNPNYSVAHPSINHNGTVLYFSSTMPGGFGGSDIYVSRLINGTWTEPQNLGSAINTLGQEVFPVFHPSGRIYFSSNGHAGFGGLDVFFAEIINDTIQQARTIDAPINSNQDDFGFTANQELTVGFFTSSRNGKDEIWRFRLDTKTLSALACDTFPSTDSCVTFYNQNEEGDVKNKFLTSEWRISDGTIINGLEANHCFTKAGKYVIDLYVADKLIGAKPELNASFEYIYSGPAPCAVERIPSDINQPIKALQFKPVTFSLGKHDTYEVIWLLPNNQVLFGSTVQLPGTMVVPGDTIKMIAKVRNLESQQESLYCVQTTLE